MSLFRAVAFSTLFLALILLNLLFGQTSVVGETTSTTVFNDEFNVDSLDSRWKWENPRQDCSLNLTENLGHLRIHVHGNNHDLDIPNGNQNAPRILQTISGDFVIETMVVFKPRASLQSAGVLLWSNSSSFIRYERSFTSESPNHIITVREAITTTPYTTGGWIEAGSTAYTDDIVHMKVERVGNSIAFSYAYNATEWSLLASDKIPMSESLSVGLFAIVQGNDDLLFADFDFFRVSKKLPSPPTNLRAIGGTGLVMLVWSPSEYNGGVPITNYKIYRGNSPNGEIHLTTLGNTTTFNDTDISAGQLHYYYKVSAVTSAGESDLSNEANVIPLSVAEETPLDPIVYAMVLIALVATAIPLLTYRKRISVKNIRGWLEENRREVAVATGWTTAATLILIKIYTVFYIYNPWQRSGLVPMDIYKVPIFTSFDLVLWFFVSLIAGMLLIDIDRVFYGYLVSMILSICIALAYATLYIWYVLGWGGMLSTISFSWEWAVYWAALNMFRVVFPFPIILAFLGGFFGSLLRSWIRP